MTEITFNECVHVTRPNWFDIIRQWKHDLDATHIFFQNNAQNQESFLRRFTVRSMPCSMQVFS
jgi:hypothetical protein